MRITSRFGAVFASSALAASMMVGGAAMAQAQDQGSLGSLMPGSDVGLTVSVEDETVGGVLTNNTEEALNCDVGAADAELIAEVQALVEGGDSLEDALDEAGFDDGNSGTTTVEAAAADEAEWTAEGIEVDDEFTAGAFADCGDDVEPVFADDSSGLLGSLDFGGSLES